MSRKNAFQKVAVEHDKEALFDMQRAATLTAISYSNTFSGLIHSVAHTLTAKYGIYHSKAVASILVACLEFYKDACEKEYSQMLLFSLGAKEYSTLDAKERCDVFITLFRNLINFISSSVC